jgi:hypothetical protein
MTYRVAKNKDGETIKVPVFDVRESKEECDEVNQIVKVSNGNNSKYVPPKWGFGAFGPIKY